MKLVKLVDGALLKFLGIGIIRTVTPEYIWRARYDKDGIIYMWLRDERPLEGNRETSGT